MSGGWGRTVVYTRQRPRHGQPKLCVRTAGLIEKCAAPKYFAVSPSTAPRPTSTRSSERADRVRFVPETKFGQWFLGTNTWARYVVTDAMRELVQLMPRDARPARRILDAGSGPGVSLGLLEEIFQPEEIIAIEADPHEVGRSRAAAKRCRCQIEVRYGDAARTRLESGSVDLVLCHQTLHHVIDQEGTLAEFHRVLAPGGVLLLAESCREFIMSSSVQWLFRHPNHVQKSAAEYQALVRAGGFVFGPENVRVSIPYWSRPDWGLLRRLGWRSRNPEEPTQVTLAALRP